MNALLHPFTSPRQTEFLTLVGGEGAEVWDASGRRYIDARASLWYMNVGHGHPRMVEAITRQATALASYHTFAPFSNGPAEQLADRIIDKSPFERGRVFLGSSGSEAVDSAMKIARIAQREAGRPDKTMILSRQHGYHGTNFGGTSAQGIAVNREGFGELVGNVVNVAGADIEPMARMFADHGDSVAAVISEPLQGAGGVYPPPEGYLEALRRLCDEHDAFLIFDEVITGFGRLGSWFGAQHYGVQPDMITFAKAVSSGYIPLGGVITGPAVTDALMANEGFILKHGYTYSGHPVAAAAGLEAMAIQEDEGLIERVPGIAARLAAGLQALLADGLVTDVRGAGAVWAVTVPDGRDASRDRFAALDLGVIVRPLGDSLVLCPPLVITDAQVDRCVDVLAEVLGY